MRFTDFIFDDESLSDKGYQICSFNSASLDTIDSGGELVFNTVSMMNGRYWPLTSSNYGSCLQATFEICKLNCVCEDGISRITFDSLEISDGEFANLCSWLLRQQFHSFYPCDENGKLRITTNYLTNHAYFYEGSFTKVNRIEDAGVLVGLELTFTTNRPFAIGDTVTETLDFTSDLNQSVTNKSSCEGVLYPHTEIVIATAGDLSIYSTTEDRYVTINNCSFDENITMDYPMIQTNLASHIIQNDFNWNFFRITGSYNNNNNNFISTLKCVVVFTYNPIITIGI